MSGSKIVRISPTEAHEKMRSEGFTYVDVRTEGEFLEGRPAGAINVPFGVFGWLPLQLAQAAAIELIGAAP